MALKVRFKPKFPTNVVGANGLSASLTGGVVTVEPSFDDQAAITSISAGDQDNMFALLLDTDDGVYKRIRLDALVAAATPTGAELSKVDDTNVTLTLGGAPTTALVNAASLTLGWAGQLALTRGGTAASLTASNGGLIYSTDTALAVLSGTATAGQIAQSGSSAAPTWSTATYPATAAQGTILAAGTANVVSATATPTLGIAGTTIGTLALAGNTSGTATITPQAAAGTPTLTLPNASGTFVVSATSPLVRSATTGDIVLSGAAGTVATGTGAGTTFSFTPTLGAAGAATGKLLLSGTTSGTVTIQPQDAAGTFNFNLPTSAGSAGQVLYSGGGGSTAMAFGATPLRLSITITGVNFNSANTDNAIAITLPPGFTRYSPQAVRIFGASASLTTATFGMFTATGGGGTTLIGAGTAITVSTASENTANNLQAAAVGTSTTSFTVASVPTIYFRVGTAQGSAATGNVQVEFIVLA